MRVWATAKTSRRNTVPLSEKEIELVDVRSEIQGIEKDMDQQFHIFEKGRQCPSR